VAPPNSFRLKIFYKFLPHVSAFFRRRRMARIARLMHVRPGMKVLDLGGTPSIWEHMSVPLDITLLNLPGAVTEGEHKVLQSAPLKHHTFHTVEGNALDVVQFRNRSFDLVFSNSVIEHVGPAENQAAFAREVRRLGKAYWVQTPSKWFPIEAHCGVPFYWLYPQWVRDALMKGWQKRLPQWWSDYMGETRVLSRRQMAELFPEAITAIEYFYGIPKSYVAYAEKVQVSPAETNAPFDHVLEA
jgi:hypothetical protein